MRIILRVDGVKVYNEVIEDQKLAAVEEFYFGICAYRGFNSTLGRAASVEILSGDGISVIVPKVGGTYDVKTVAEDADGNVIEGAVLTYRIADESVATVSADGTLTAVAAGTTTLTVTNGSVSDIIRVYVPKKLSDFEKYFGENSIPAHGSGSDGCWLNSSSTGTAASGTGVYARSGYSYKMVEANDVPGIRQGAAFWDRTLSDHTVAFWIYDMGEATAFKANYGCFGGLGVNPAASVDYYACYGETVNGNTAIVGATPIARSTGWHEFRYVFGTADEDGKGTVKMYIDGVLAAEMADVVIPGSVSTSTNRALSFSRANSSGWPGIYIDDVVIAPNEIIEEPAIGANKVAVNDLIADKANWVDSLITVGRVVVTVAGKNLVQPSENRVLNGITKTVNPDGSFTLKGTATADIWLRTDFYATAGAPHILSGCPGTGATNTYTQYVSENGLFYWDFGEGVTFTPLTNGLWPVYTLIRSGVTMDATFYQMVRLADTDAAFEAPKAIQTLTASNGDGLHGIPVSSGGNYTDEAGQQWICDEIDFARGVYVQRINTVTADTVAASGKYSISTSAGIPCIDIARAYTLGVNASALSNCYSQINTSVTGTHGTFKNWENQVTIYDTRFTSLENAVSLLAEAGFVMLLRLAEPIETALTAEELAQYAALRSNKPNTTVFNDAGAGMKLSYVADTKTYIDQKLAAISAAMLNA